MAQLFEYFEKHTSKHLTHTNHWVALGGHEIPIRVCIEMETDTRFVIFYVNKNAFSFPLCIELIQKSELAFEQSAGLIAYAGAMGDMRFGSEAPLFSRKVFMYHEEEFTKEQISILAEWSNTLDIRLILRGKEYVEKMNSLEKPLAFVSHDSRDKAEVALPIVTGLQKRLCPVWYDEYSLKVGDSLRESIENGLKEARKCILILSPNFLSNTGWTKTEFNSIFTRELIEK